MDSVLEDINKGKGYILGVIAFATAVSAFLIQVWHFRPEPTILAVAGFALMILTVGWLIHKSEQRQAKALTEHIDVSQSQMIDIKNTLNDIKNITIENQKASLRIEMGNEIKRHPENHDTILRMAERYFLPPDKGGLGGDWYMSSVFLDWAEKENVSVPQILHTFVKD